jgi:hypothetical protein
MRQTQQLASILRGHDSIHGGVHATPQYNGWAAFVKAVMLAAAPPHSPGPHSVPLATAAATSVGSFMLSSWCWTRLLYSALRPARRCTGAVLQPAAAAVLGASPAGRYKGME